LSNSCPFHQFSKNLALTPNGFLGVLQKAPISKYLRCI